MTTPASIFAFLSWLDVTPMLPRPQPGRNRKLGSIRLDQRELLGGLPLQGVLGESLRDYHRAFQDQPPMRTSISARVHGGSLHASDPSRPSAPVQSARRGQLSCSFQAVPSL